MKKLYILVVLIVCMLFQIDEAYGQRKGRNNSQKGISKYRGPIKKFQNQDISLGVSANIFNYFGDLAPRPSIISTNLSMTRPGIGLVGSYRLASRISVRGTFTYGRVKAADNGKGTKEEDESIYRQMRNLSFRNDIKELAITGVFDLFEYNRSSPKRFQFTPYAFLGIAVFHHNPKGKVPDDFDGPEAGKWVALQPLGTEGQYVDDSGVAKYSKIQVAIPLGIGVRYKLNQQFDLAFEIGYRHLFFDHLDDVGGNYIDKNRFGDNALARVMSDRSGEFIPPTVLYKSPYGDDYLVTPGYGHENSTELPNIRGNSKYDDVYIVTSLQLTYILGSSGPKGARFK